MLIVMKSLLSTLLYLSSVLICCQLYPMDGGKESMYGNYGMGLAKKDPSLALKNSLLTALLLSERQKAGTPNQRKKAVDSTFIRFGRSSMSGSYNRHPNYLHGDDTSQDFNYYSDDDLSKKTYPDSMTVDNVEVMKPDLNGDQSKSSSNMQAAYPINHNRCLVKTNDDLYRVLMDKNCVKYPLKTKRENVNDTFIRFGKRDVSAVSQRAEGPEAEIKYGR